MKIKILLLITVILASCSECVIPINAPKELTAKQKCQKLHDEFSQSDIQVFVDGLPIQKVIILPNKEKAGLNCTCYHNSDKVDFDTIYFTKASEIITYIYKKDTLNVISSR